MNKQTHNFNQSKKVGDSGERAVADLLDEECRYYVDVTEQKEFFEPDIDFICIRDNLDSDYIELKTDTYTSSNGNIALETWSNYEAETRGWYYECEADYLWYFALPEVVYEFKLDELRDFFGEDVASLDFEEKYVQNAGYSSRVVIVPLEDIPEKLYVERPVRQVGQENTE